MRRLSTSPTEQELVSRDEWYLSCLEVTARHMFQAARVSFSLHIGKNVLRSVGVNGGLG